jgi:serine/threonine protein kinase
MHDTNMHALVSCMEWTLACVHEQVEVLSSMQHERIVGLLGACLAPPNICIVEELAPGGSLFDLLHTRAEARACKPLPHRQACPPLQMSLHEAIVLLKVSCTVRVWH